MTKMDTGFTPDWASPPGDTILDLLEEKNWTQVELAQRVGFTPKHVNQLIKGKVPLTEEAAVRLARVLGGTVSFWLTREAQYRERCAHLDAEQQAAGWIEWLKQLPLKEMMRAGVIEKRTINDQSKPSLVRACLAFFAVASPTEWEKHYGMMHATFRRTRKEQSDDGAIAVWLRMGERKAESLHPPKYDRTHFESVLDEMRTLTVLAPEHFGPRLHALFQASGVAFVLTPAIPKAHVSGVVRWLHPHQPLIQLSLYGKRNDRFWFTLFHEVAHILLHAHQKKVIYLSDTAHQTDSVSQDDQEADSWARDFLIPESHLPELRALTTEEQVLAFAQRLGIHPAIVVGRLQHDGLLAHAHMNYLKVSLTFGADQPVNAQDR